MTTHEAELVLRRLVEEVMNPGDLGRAGEVIADDFVDHYAPPWQQASGLAGFKQGSAGVRAAFPDMQTTVEDTVATGDKVAFRLTLRGTHLGTFAGVPATGKAVTYTGVGIVRVADGKIAERWLRVDIPGVLTQIGGYFGPQPARAE
jgi:steroid delta-isomerase-like uncharacterized protein